MSPETDHYETAKPLLPISSGMKDKVDTFAKKAIPLRVVGKDLVHVEEG